MTSAHFQRTLKEAANDHKRTPRDIRGMSTEEVVTQCLWESFDTINALNKKIELMTKTLEGIVSVADLNKNATHAQQHNALRVAHDMALARICGVQ